MKLVCTVTDVSAVVYAEGSPDVKSAVVEIPNDQLPPLVQTYFEQAEIAKNLNKACNLQLTFSILDE